MHSINYILAKCNIMGLKYLEMLTVTKFKLHSGPVSILHFVYLLYMYQKGLYVRQNEA